MQLCLSPLGTRGTPAASVISIQRSQKRLDEHGIISPSAFLTGPSHLVAASTNGMKLIPLCPPGALGDFIANMNQRGVFFPCDILPGDPFVVGENRVEVYLDRGLGRHQLEVGARSFPVPYHLGQRGKIPKLIPGEGYLFAILRAHATPAMFPRLFLELLDEFQGLVLLGKYLACLLPVGLTFRGINTIEPLGRAIGF